MEVVVHARLLLVSKRQQIALNHCHSVYFSVIFKQYNTAEKTWQLGTEQLLQQNCSSHDQVLTISFIIYAYRYMTMVLELESVVL